MHRKSKKVISRLLAVVMLLTTAFSNIDVTKVFASDTTNSRKIDVWDFGGSQTSGELYNNIISANTLDELATVSSTGTIGLFAGGQTDFGDLSISKPDPTDRLYYYGSDGTTKGARSYGTWGNAKKTYDDGYTSNGCYYCNGTGGDSRRYLTIRNVTAGDNISVYGATSNGNEDIHLVYLGTDGKQDTSLPFTITAQRVDFVAKYSGEYKIYVTAMHSGKPYFHRVVRTPGVKVSGKVNLNDNNTNAAFTFVNQTSGETTEAAVNADNTFDMVLAPGYKYTAVLNGTNAYKFSAATKVVTISASDITNGVNNLGLDVVANPLATISGGIKGFDSSYDVSKLQIKLVPPQETLSPEVVVTIDKATMKFNAIVEQGITYTAVISGVNDYEITAGSSVNIKTDTAQDIQVTKKAVYAATGKFLNLSASAKIQSISFTNVDDGYKYDGTIKDGGYSVSLRDGSYAIKAVCNESYETTTHLVVNGQNTTKDIKFNQVNGWNLVNVTSEDITAGKFNGLTLQNGTGAFKVNGNSLAATAGSSIIIPVAAGEIVTVSGWYSGEIFFNEDPSNKLVIPGTSTASAPATLSYQSKTTGTVTLNVTGKATAYLTAIDRVQSLNRVSDLYVGDSTKKNNFNTVKEAIAAAARMNPTSEAERITIHIAPGVYRAQLIIATPYISLVNSDPSKEVKITWYYGFGYEYYSVGSDGFYSEDRAFDRYSKGHVSEGKWGGSVFLTKNAKEFKAENIVFENSFNKYVTEEELADGVAICKNFPQSASGTLTERTASTDVTSRVNVERAAAMINEADNVEFYKCSFLSSQDTLFTGSYSSNQYFKNCFIEGNTDYIFGDGDAVFDDCTLNFCGYSDKASGGYITAAKDTAAYGYLFRNSNVTANNKNMQTAGFFGRPWGPKAKVKFANTKLESSSIIDPKGWTDMSGASPEKANFAEYNTTYNGAAVDTTSRRATVLSGESEIAGVGNYFGDWTPKYYTGVINYDLPKENFKWDSIVFGQSTSAANTVEIDSAKNQVTVNAGTKDGSATGGKITGSHDGIAYYYTEVDPSKNFELSADIKVNFFGKATPDNQEGFGIMARDAIGKNGDTTVFPSNMVMVGGYRGLVQSVFRNNVKDASGAGAVMEDVFKFGERPSNDGTATYKMTMKKTNTGYQVSVNNGKEVIYYRPKQLEVLDSGKIYVGFFAARVASITVTNINMKTSKVATDAPGVPEPVKGIAPAISFNSLSATSSTNYDLKVSANVNGNLQIKLADKEIYNGAVNADKELTLGTTLVSGDNTFNMVLTPDSTEKVTSADPVSLKKVVTVKSYGALGGAIYVSPTGTEKATGTEKDPIDIYSATKFISEGQTIYVRGGVYNLTAPITIERGNDGTGDKPKVLSAYPNERPVFDFGTKSQGFNLAGDAWKVYGIDVTKASSTGFRVSGNYNVVEMVNTYANGDTGLQISGSSLESKDKWPTNNLILNCTSYDNRDTAENNADGFAAKLTVGAGNVFRGCISHNNTDDGWDLYSKSESGPIEPVIIENCVAYGNGTLTNGTKTKGDGNGFKLGGEGLPVKHILRNSLSFGNNSAGVTSNSDPAIIVENVTSVDNGKANFSFAYYTNATPQFVAKNNISFRTKAGEADSFPSYLASEDNYFYNGTASVNASGKQVVTKDFKSVTAPASVNRSAEGNIAIGDYMVLASDSTIKSGAKLNDYSNITNPQKKPVAAKDSTTSPKTGDYSSINIIIFAVLALMSAAGIVVFRKKKTE
jgi:LPXTG-motif cell wall-anchored protein